MKTQLDNSLPEGIVVPLSRTDDFFFLEGSPTEAVPFFSLIKPNPSPLPRFVRERIMFATPCCQYTSRKPGAQVKLLMIGGLVGLVIRVALTVFYFSLATFFAVNAKALEATQTAAENGNANSEEKKKRGGLDKSAKEPLGLAERSPFPQKISPGKVKEY
jgi:hypothetical protein